jgi:polyisoprenoid-binding protein YceI
MHRRMRQIRKVIELVCAAFAIASLTGLPSAAAEETRPSSGRYAVATSNSHLEITGHDSVYGNHTLTFDRWWATIDTSVSPARMHFEIDTTSLRSNEPLVSSIVKNQLLDVAKYPRATLDGTLVPGAKPGELVVDGTATIHGRSNPLHFTGTIRAEGSGFYFEGALDISRRAYGLVSTPVEPFLDDVFHVAVAAVAVPEAAAVKN